MTSTITAHNRPQQRPEGASLPNVNGQGVRRLTRASPSQSNVGVALRNGSPRSMPEPPFSPTQPGAVALNVHDEQSARCRSSACRRLSVLPCREGGSAVQLRPRLLQLRHRHRAGAREGLRSSPLPEHGPRHRLGVTLPQGARASTGRPHRRKSWSSSRPMRGPGSSSPALPQVWRTARSAETSDTWTRSGPGSAGRCGTWSRPTPTRTSGRCYVMRRAAAGWHAPRR